MQKGGLGHQPQPLQDSYKLLAVPLALTRKMDDDTQAINPRSST